MTEAEVIDLCQKEINWLKDLLSEERNRVAELQTQRREWDAERRYLVDSLMELTGAPRPQPETKEVAETAARHSGPQRRSWNQVIVGMEQQSAIRKQKHLEALASAAKAKGVENAS